MKNMTSQKGLAPIAIILIIAGGLIAAGGVWYWQKNKGPIEVYYPDETNDWKTYRNEEYGFEIKYPNDWSHRGDVMSEYFGKSFSENSIDFNCSFGVAVITNPDYFKNAYPSNKRVNVNIGDIPAIKIEGLSGGINYGDYLIKGDKQNNSFEITETIEKIITNKDGQRVAFGTVNNQGCINTFNQILSTFKFIK